MRGVALALCAFTLASCADCSSRSSSWWLRYHPEKNEAVYVEILDDLTAGADAAEPLRKLVGGWRRYPPEGGLLVFDLDEEPDWEDVSRETEAEKLREILASLRREVVVTDTGLFRVGSDGVGFYRVTHIKDLSAFLKNANEMLNIFLHEGWMSEGIEMSWEHFEIGEETKARWMERASKREPWLALRGRTFLLDIPMTEHEAAGFLRAVIEDAKDFPADSWFMEALTSIRIADGSMRLGFAPAGDRFQESEGKPGATRGEGHGALLQALETEPGFQEFDRAQILERVK